MSTAIIDNNTTIFKNKEYVAIPKEDFLEYQKFSNNKKEEYPKEYITIDEEWVWETLDFWPEWIDPKELLLVHNELKNGKTI